MSEDLRQYERVRVPLNLNTPNWSRARDDPSGSFRR